MLIAIEAVGIAGVEQTLLLHERLLRNGFKSELIVFPTKNSPLNELIKKNQALAGNPKASPYRGSILYGVAHFEAADTIFAALNDDTIVLVVNYVGQALAKQGQQFENAEQRRGFFIWHDNLEFELLGVPRPEKTFVLRGLDKTQQSVTIGRVYDDLCQLFPRDFTRLDCVRSGQQLTDEMIQDLLWKSVKALLPETEREAQAVQPLAEQNQASQSVSLSRLAAAHLGSLANPKKRFTKEYFVPPGFDAATLRDYQKSLDTILKLSKEIKRRIDEHATQSGLSAADLNVVSQLTLPVANLTTVTVSSRSFTTDQRNTLAETSLPELLQFVGSPANNKNKAMPQLETSKYGTSMTDGVELFQRFPQNEFDLLVTALNLSSDDAQQEIKEAVDAWPIAKKELALQQFIKGSPILLGQAIYGWDFVTNLGQAFRLAGQVPPQSFRLYQPTPRYGFDTPTIIDELGLNELFENCFEISLSLHSLLQNKGYTEQSQYAVLLGNRTRWKMTGNGNALVDFMTSALASSVTADRQLINQMYGKLEAVHPLIASALPLNQQSTPVEQQIEKRLTNFKLTK